MTEIIVRLNQISDVWFRIIALNSLHLTILFIFLLGITALLRNKAAVLLYSLWSLFLLKAALPPVFRLPFFRHTVMPVIPLNAIVANPGNFLPSPQTGAAVSVTIQSILLLLWIAGIIAMLTIYIRNEHLFYLSLKQSKLFPDQNKLQELAVQLGIRKTVELRCSANVPAPFTKGFRKPVIYLPRTALDWNANQLHHVLCHELAHIQRKDIVIITIQNILNVLYFFHPLVWIANHQLNFQREKICDDTAIALLNENPASYGRTLMDNLESFLVHRRLPLITNGLFSSKKTIIRRFEYLLNRGKEIKMNLGLIQKTALILFSVFIIFSACNNWESESPVSTPEETEMAAPLPKIKFIPYDSPPKPIGGFKAIRENVIYPQAEQAAGHEGTVVVQTFVDKYGNVSDTTAILRSPGFKGLEEAAIRAIKQTKFEPAIRKDKPVGVYISIPVIFKLDDAKETGNARQSDNQTYRFVPYDSPPKPVGGFAAIQNNIELPDKKGIDGTTIIKTYIDTNGKATQTSIEQSCDNKDYDQAAITATEKTEFIPAQQRDKTIGVWITIPVVFKT